MSTTRDFRLFSVLPAALATLVATACSDKTAGQVGTGTTTDHDSGIAGDGTSPDGFDDTEDGSDGPEGAPETGDPGPIEGSEGEGTEGEAPHPDAGPDGPDEGSEGLATDAGPPPTEPDASVTTDAGTPDAAEPSDAGESSDGAAPEDSDAGSDAGMPSHDAGTPDEDAGADAGADTPDAGDGDTDAGFVQPPIFDMPMIADPTTADCAFTNQRTAIKNGVTLDVWNVSYYSWESRNGKLEPIKIRGVAAKPAGQQNNIPGVIQAHGLGGFAEESHATGVASLLDMFVIAYTGPGGGTGPDNTSEGLPASHDANYRIFDSIPDARGPWFWGHAVAAMRGITCLTTRPEVDASRIGITGFSGGGVVSLMAAGVDARVKAAVPLSGTGAWHVATEYPGAWQNALLQTAGLNNQSPQYTKLATTIDAAYLVKSTQAKILMVDGSTDEFFPITAFMATFNNIPEPAKRMALAGNFDHGCYALTGIESAKNIEERALIRSEGNQRMWFKHWFKTDLTFDYLPAEPVLNVIAQGPAALVTVIADAGGSRYDIERVHFWWSSDRSVVYGNVEIGGSGTTYTAIVPVPIDANTIYYADVQYKTKALLNPARFAVATRPVIPPGMVAKTRNINNCLVEF